MEDAPFLRDLVILVAVAIPVVLGAQRLRIPTIVGFLLTGVLIGPHSLGLIAHSETVNRLAEVGVVLLLFAVGLELSLSRVRKMGRLVVQVGGLQVFGTIAAAGGIAVVAGMEVNRAIFIGSLVALSSTAIVLKSYSAREELDTPHGRVAVAVAIFQDLAVVPLILLVPLFAGALGGIGPALRQVVVSLIVVAVVVAGGRYAVPWLLERIVAARNREVFTLAIVVVGLGAAYVVSLFGISLALGAFLAGLVVSESEYGLQALSDVLPFRDVFSGIFFASVGMLLDLGALVGSPGVALTVAFGVILVKALVAAGAVVSAGRSLRVGIVSGLGLAQVGEFSFVLAAAGISYGLLTGMEFQLFIAASVLSMLLAPFLIEYARPIAVALTDRFGHVPLRVPRAEVSSLDALSDHVIIVGYGLNGRNVARSLRGAGIPYVILEQNAQAVRRAREEGEPIFFGDGTHQEVLERVGVARARVVVYCIAAPEDERRGVAAARYLNPSARLIVRTRYVREIEELQRLGAHEVVPEEFETSLEIFARVLRRYGVPASTIRREVEAVRRDHYEMFTEEEAPFDRLGGVHEALGVQVGVETMDVEEGSAAIGGNPVTMALRRLTGATLIAVMREGEALYEPEPGFGFRAGDVVVLVGRPEAIEAAAGLFRSGGGTAPGRPLPAPEGSQHEA